MIASFHVLEYEKWVFSPARRLAGQVAGLRFWRPLNVGGDFAWFRDHPGRWGLYRRLKPDFHRWAFYGVWDDERALDAFLEHSTLARSWNEGCAQAWHLWLRPLRVRGPWQGMRILETSASDMRADGPVAVLARLDLTIAGTLMMWGVAAPQLLHHLANDDEMLIGIPLVDRPYVQPVSFSVWRSAADAMRFAYQGNGHPGAVARLQHAQHDVVTRFSVGRFDPYRSEGTWNGRVPLENTIRVCSPAPVPDAPDPTRSSSPANGITEMLLMHGIET